MESEIQEKREVGVVPIDDASTAASQWQWGQTPHYNQGKIEVIDFIEDQDLPFHLGNALKYICRCRHKGEEILDVQKAIFYLERYVIWRQDQEREKTKQQ